MTWLGYRLECEFTVSAAIGQLIIWLILALVTFGLALFVLPYYFVRAPINRSYLLDPAGRKVARLSCEVTLADNIGHVILWILLTIVTLGLAYLVYWPAVIKRVLNGVVVNDL